MRKLLASSLIVAIASTASAQNFKIQKWNIGGEGGTDYLVAEPGTNRVFVSRGTHVMVVDGTNGKVLGDIPNTPRMHGIAFSAKANHGFTTNAGDSTLTMFDLKTLAFIKKIKIPQGGLDGIMYDADEDLIVLTNHGPRNGHGTLVSVDPVSGDVKNSVEVEDWGPEGAVSNGKGWIYVNNENTHTVQVFDVKKWSAVKSWKVCADGGPTGIAYDKPTDRIFSGCDDSTSVVNGTTGAVVARIPNGGGVDALGYDPSEKLIYIPAGENGTVTIAHQDGPDKYTVVATVNTMPGPRSAKTIAVDPVKHVAYLFQPEYGPAPAGATGGGRGGPPRPIVAAWFFAITH